MRLMGPMGFLKSVCWGMRSGTPSGAQVVFTTEPGVSGASAVNPRLPSCSPPGKTAAFRLAKEAQAGRVRYGLKDNGSREYAYECSIKNNS